MDPGASTKRTSTRTATDIVWIAGGVAASLIPYLDRLKHPSLYTDDVTRIAQLRMSPLDRLLFLPFNEHMAPLFQFVSWLTWLLADERLARAPLAFTLASFVPFALSLGLLGWLIRNETGSVLAAIAGLALFGQSWLASETVYWYSASSFMWALALSLVAWLGAAWFGAGRPIRGVLGIALATATAPAFSAIGLLAAPLAMIRLLAGNDGLRPRRRLFALFVPIAGTLAYLAVCWAFRYGEVLSDSLGRNLHLRAGLIVAIRAPIDFLVPGLFGLHPIGNRLSQAASLALSALGIGAALYLATRTRQRAMVLGGLFLILGGYALTFCPRCDEHGHFAQLIGQRYHLFPQLGLALVLVPPLHDILRRCEARPGVGLLAVGVLAALLVLSHARDLKSWSRFFRYPDQPRTLAALDHLESLCNERGITRAQALAALDPIQTSWSTPGFNALEMLGSRVQTSNCPDSRVRSILLTSLSPAEREAVCGGMDASPYLRRGTASPDLIPAAVGHLEGSSRLQEAGQGRWLATGRPAYLEYEVPAIASGDGQAVRGLALPLDMPGGGSIEVWWRGDHDRWSETRSVRCRFDVSQSGQGPGWVLPTDRLPHWSPREARHLRLLFRTPGLVAVGTPWFLRQRL